MLTTHVFLATTFLISLSRGTAVYEDDPSDIIRLPDDVIPNAYKIELHPDMDGENFTFSGETVISITFRNQTDEIKLHSKNLEFKNPIELRCNSGTYNLSRDGPDPTTDILTLHITNKTAIEADSICKLTMKYQGGNDGKNNGFYRMFYTNAEGKEKRMATTFFQPIAARKVFPCWDEPAFKANFTISIIHSLDDIVLSNMHAIASERFASNSSMNITSFAESPKMSTYLVAIAVGEFASVVNDDKDFEVWTRKEVVDQAKYAVQIGPKIMKALENYTNFPYKTHGFSKMQILAIPRIESNVLGMENWGFVTILEESLLFSENANSTSYKEGITYTLAHELAHQWFGNLVTPAWWKYLWLSEAFATYFGYVIVDKIEPTWHMMDKFVVNVLQPTGYFTMLGNPVERTIKKIDFEENFGFRYSSACFAGAFIIRMISHIVGEEQFQTAIRNYVKKNAFQSVMRSDLADALMEATDGNITNLENFIEIYVMREVYSDIDVQRNYRNGTALIWKSYPAPPFNYFFNFIPINYVTEGDLDFADTKVTYWFDKNSDNIMMEMPSNDEFVIFNKQQFGFYHVNYDKKNWLMIDKYLKTNNYTNIHVLNRAQLIDDAFHFVDYNELGFKIVLSLIAYLKAETDSVPWTAAWRGIEMMFIIVANTDLEKIFKDYVVEISDKLVKEVVDIDLIASDHIMKIKKAETLKWACKYGSELCLSKAKEKFIEWLTNSEATVLPPDDEEWIMCGGIRTANQATWNKLWQKYLNNRNEKLLSALGCTSDISILNGYVVRILEENRTEIFETVIKGIFKGSNTGSNVNFMFEFLIDQYHKINEMSNGNYEKLIYKYIKADNLATKQQYDKNEKFVQNLENGNNNEIRSYLNDVVQQGFNSLKKNSEALEKIRSFFEERTSKNGCSKQFIHVFSYITVIGQLMVYSFHRALFI